MSRDVHRNRCEKELSSEHKYIALVAFGAVMTEVRDSLKSTTNVIFSAVEFAE